MLTVDYVPGSALWRDVTIYIDFIMRSSVPRLWYIAEKLHPGLPAGWYFVEFDVSTGNTEAHDQMEFVTGRDFYPGAFYAAACMIQPCLQQAQYAGSKPHGMGLDHDGMACQDGVYGGIRLIRAIHKNQAGGVPDHIDPAGLIENCKVAFKAGGHCHERLKCPPASYKANDPTSNRIICEPDKPPVKLQCTLTQGPYPFTAIDYDKAEVLAVVSGGRVPPCLQQLCNLHPGWSGILIKPYAAA